MADRSIKRCPSCGRRERRSSQANALYWVLLHRIAEKLRHEGQQYSAEQYHWWARSKFLGCDDMTLPDGQVLTIPKSTAQLDVAEFSEYFERLQAWAAENDVYLDELPA